MSRLSLRLVALGATLLLCFVVIVLINERDRGARDAEFLSKCREASYDADKCRFFLTDPGE